MDRERQLHAHVHNLLYDYAKAYITVDYIGFTEDVVTAVSSYCLKRRVPRSLTVYSC